MVSMLGFYSDWLIHAILRRLAALKRQFSADDHFQLNLTRMKMILATFQPLIRKTVRLVANGLLFAFFMLLTIFVTAMFFALPITKLGQPTFDTMPITNYCFAIMGGCASICFSWARNVDPLNTKLARQITFCGERSFLSAIVFVVASAMKYFVVHQADFPIKQHSPLLPTMSVLALLSFVLSLIVGLSSLFYMLKVLVKQVITDKKFEEL
jgi:hypothetical protein